MLFFEVRLAEIEHYTDQLEDSLSRPKFETGINKKRTRQPLKYQVKVRTESFRFIIVQCTLSLEVRLAVKDRPGTTSKPNKQPYLSVLLQL